MTLTGNTTDSLVFASFRLAYEALDILLHLTPGCNFKKIGFKMNQNNLIAHLP